jgi:hypothetical protein
MRSIVWYLGLRCVLLELIKRTGAEGIGAYETSFEAASLVPAGEFCAGGCLSGTLETDEHDDVCFAFLGLEGFGVRVDELDEFVEDGLGSS